MHKEEAVQRVCAGLCPFYKPGKADELSCNGFAVVQKLIGQRRIAAYADENASPASPIEDALFHAVCTPCPFFERDCDFASWKRGESPRVTRGDVDPCGGLLFLACAVQRGSMDIQEVYRVI